MTAKVKSTGKIIKNVGVYKEGPNSVVLLYIDEDTNTIYKAEDLEVGCDEPIELLTEEKAYDDYQERSTTAGDRAERLAWMFVVMMAGGLISGHAFQTFSVCAVLSAIYMLLSVMQAVWQTFTSWLFMRQIRKTDAMPNDYPSWVGCGAWLFFWLKMISISAAVFYFARVIFL